jgi:hypothetical protein
MQAIRVADSLRGISFVAGSTKALSAAVKGVGSSSKPKIG